MKLKQHVKLNSNVARSVNLERDFGVQSVLENYQITKKGLNILGRFVESLRGNRISAWSITGPYGMGKSTFLNFLSSIAGSDSNSLTKLAREKLIQADQNLFKSFLSAMRICTNGKGLLRVPITAAYEPINKTLSSGILRAIEPSELISLSQSKPEIKVKIEELSQQRVPNSQELFEIFIDIRDSLKQPILLIIDEFGKNLEFMAHHPDKGDIYIMQLLAEATDIHLFVCLHQAFEEYASSLTSQQRREWSKVQGRFEDISFLEPPRQMLALAKRAIVHSENHQFKKQIKQWAQEIKGKMRELNVKSLHFMDESLISSLYPLHPIAAAVLPELCRRFAQNDRTLFSFLCSSSPNALPYFIENSEVDERLPTLGLDYLYDYFFSMSTTSLTNRPQAQRWIEIQDIISQSQSFSPISQTILKTVGVLNLITGTWDLAATKELVKFSIENVLGISSEAIDREIETLSNRKILLFREYAGEYRLWEGSDFDIPKAILKKKASIATRPLQEILQNFFPQSPLIASRHSYETGTIRRFTSRWMNITDLEDATPQVQEEFDGLIVYAFGSQPYVGNLPKFCADHKPLIIVYSPHENQIKELVLEAAATRAVLREAPELRRDGVARKEVRFRVQAAENQLREYLSQIFSPGSNEAIWFAEGKKQEIFNHRALSSLASKLCDRVYSSCPIIRNEMINYDRLSSSAARACRELAEAMVAHQREENLGLTGYGPEVAIYRSFFLSTELHKYSEDNGYHFVAPDTESDLWPLWEAVTNKVAEAGSKGVGVDALIELLKKPPFGMKEGPIPIYICMFLLVNSDEIALFQEGIYKPYFAEAEIALLIKRPELFTLKQFTPVGVRRDIFEIYLNILNKAEVNQQEGIRNPTLLSVVGPLIKFVEELPYYSKFTRRISRKAQRVRSAIINSREPMDLLFKEIPKALGIDPSKVLNEQSRNELQKQLRESLLEIMEAFPKLNKEVKENFMEAFNCEGNFKECILNCIQRSELLLPAAKERELVSVLRSMNRDSVDPEEWMRGVAGRIMKLPLEKWSDGDIDTFNVAIRDFADRIDHLEELVSSISGISKSNNKNHRLIGVMYPGGSMFRKIIRPQKKELKRAEKFLKSKPDLTRDEQEALLALLSDKLIKERK